MKGFKVEFKDDSYLVSSVDGVFGVYINHINQLEETKLVLHGSDNSFVYKWLDTCLEMGDEIKISFTEFTEPSECDKKQIDNDKEHDEFIIKSKISSYKRLKKELEDGGHI